MLNKTKMNNMYALKNAILKLRFYYGLCTGRRTGGLELCLPTFGGGSVNSEVGIVLCVTMVGMGLYGQST